MQKTRVHLHFVIQQKTKRTHSPTAVPADENFIVSVARIWPIMRRARLVQVISSIPPDYVVDPFWASQRGERVGEATPRRHRPFSYEFMEAKYWPHRGGRYGKAASQLGYRPNPACTVNCHQLPAAYGDDPPSLRVPRRRSGQPDAPVSVSTKLPPFKVDRIHTSTRPIRLYVYPCT